MLHRADGASPRQALFSRVINASGGRFHRLRVTHHTFDQTDCEVRQLQTARTPD
jgi:hypothetical protein